MIATQDEKSNTTTDSVSKSARAAMIERAVQLADMGLSIVPILPGKKSPPIKWKPYQTERAAPETICWWLGRRFKRANYGIVTGPISNLVILDADNPDTIEYVTDNCPDTPVKQRTGRGIQFVYRHPGNYVKTESDANGVTGLDIRGNGGLVVGPLSIHRTGRVYTEVQPWTPELLAKMPVYDPLWIYPDGHPGPDQLPADVPTVDVDLDERQRQASRWLAKVPGTQIGDRANPKSFWVAVQLVWGFGLGVDEAQPLMEAWGKKADQLDQHGQYAPWTAREIQYKLLDASRILEDKEGRPRGWRLRADLDAQLAHDLKKLKELRSRVEVEFEDVPHAHAEDDQDEEEDIFQGWAETCHVADNQTEDWLIPHWCEFGCLHLLTGAPFSGKSCIVAEIVAAMCRGVLFAGMHVQAVPFILLDLENKERILVKRVRSALEGDEGRIGELWHRVRTEKTPPAPMPLDFIRGLIDRMKKKGVEKGMLAIDTMRSVLGGGGKSENSNDDMGPMLYGLRRIANETGWAVVMLHHNGKHTGQYSGGTVIAGAADYLWNWTSCKKKLTATLEMDGGRDDHQLPLAFEFDLTTQRNKFVGTAAEVKKKDDANARERDLAKWVRLLPREDEPGCTRAEIEKKAVDAELVAEDTEAESKKKYVSRKLKECVDAGYARTEISTVRKANLYWKTKFGHDTAFRAQFQTAA